ncbi:MAG TPA: hypothetical protein VLH40_10570 [Atribacteraceae bacterium]|nr:hypothetical protein [Atribacteraceae bacterium]
MMVDGGEKSKTKQSRWRKPVQGLGLSPGTLVEPAERQFEETRVRVISFTQDQFREEECGTVNQALDLVNARFVTWINIDGSLEPDASEKAGNGLSPHPLVLKDIQNAVLRPKIEDLGDFF